jgi:pimeloyl-ACP methyl ester carboxylesterase
MESNREGTKSVRLARDLAAVGYHTLRFDFSYVGESEGEFADLTVTGEVEDLAGAWQYMRRQLGGPLGVIGSSLGGTVALLFAAQEPSVAAVATIAAPAHPGRRARELPAEERERWRRDGIYEVYGSRLRPTFLDDVERLDVSRTLGAVRCPLFIAHGDADMVVPCGDAKDIAAATGGPARVESYAAADHRFSDPALLDRLLSDITAWMCAQLDQQAVSVTEWASGNGGVRP